MAPDQALEALRDGYRTYSRHGGAERSERSALRCTAQDRGSRLWAVHPNSEGRSGRITTERSVASCAVALRVSRRFADLAWQLARVVAQQPIASPLAVLDLAADLDASCRTLRHAGASSSDSPRDDIGT